MQNLIWLFKMAWRDSRKNAFKLFLFLSSIVLGIAALVAINSFGLSLKEQINQEAKELLGADVELSSRQDFPDSLLNFLDSLKIEQAREYGFASMVAFQDGGTRLVNVRAVSPEYPFYGKIEMSKDGNSTTILSQSQNALVDRSLLLQFNARVGGTVKVGSSTFKISDEVIKTPGQSAITTTVAPPVFIPESSLAETGLMQKGSRINYKLYLKYPQNVDQQQLWEEVLEPRLEAEEIRFDDVEERKEELGESYSDLTGFLNLTAFIALLLGCLGVAGSVQVYVKEKTKSVAILRCLGASAKQALYIYLLQISLMGLIGSTIGAALGSGIQFYLPNLMQEFLPFKIDLSFSVVSFFQGIAIGLITSVLFALLGLQQVRKISPLKVLRASFESQKKSKFKTAIFVIILMFIFLFAFLQLKELDQALYFTLGLLLAFFSLIGIGRLIMFLVRKYFPKSSPFVVRQGLANLYRPNNQTLILVITIGLGTALLSTLFLSQDLLLNKVKLSSRANQPNMVLFDIQSDQIEEVQEMVKKDSLPVIQEVPIVTMKLAEIKGDRVNEIKEDTTSEVRNWVLNREYRVTYRDHLMDSETITKGEWVPKANPDSIVISISEGIAEDMKVDIGDEIVFNVQGALIPVYIGSFREIDWQRVQTNFLVVFPTGVLEDAPKFHVLLSKYETAEQSAELQKKLVSRFPNISVIDLDLILNTLEEVLGKISFVIQFMAFFSIVTGLIVLIGSVSISRYQRIQEAVLLRTIGAVKKQIFRINLMEYLFLGSIASLSGIFLSVLFSWGLAYFSFETIFQPRLGVLVLSWLFITALTVLIGMSNIRVVVRKTPLEILRKESA